MSTIWIISLSTLLLTLLISAGAVLVLAYKKPTQGTALVRTGQGGLQIAFDKGMYILPGLQEAEEIDLSAKKIEVILLGKSSLHTKDHKRAEIKAEFLVRPNNESDDIARIALHIGCKNASDPMVLNRLFLAKFTEAIQTIGHTFTFEELLSNRDEFKEKVLNHIGMNLDGYMLYDLAIFDINEYT